MRTIFAIASSLTLIASLSGCGQQDKPAEPPKPAYDVFSTQKEEIQKAKDVEKQMQQQAEEQRKVIEVQTK